MPDFHVSPKNLIVVLDVVELLAQLKSNDRARTIVCGLDAGAELDVGGLDRELLNALAMQRLQQLRKPKVPDCNGRAVLNQSLSFYVLLIFSQ